METTLSGTLYVYQGEEFAMGNVPLSWDPVSLRSASLQRNILIVTQAEYKDIESINYWKKMVEHCKGDEKQLEHAKLILNRKARDNARTPVQWNDGPNAGFCKEGIEPWMRVNDDYKTINAEAQRESKAAGQLTVLQFWKRGLENRKKHKDVFVYGDFQTLDDASDAVFAYKRSSKDEAFVVVLNFSGKQVDWSIPKHAGVRSWVAGNYADSSPDKPVTGTIQLQPWEGLLGTSEI